MALLNNAIDVDRSDDKNGTEAAPLRLPDVLLTTHEHALEEFAAGQSLPLGDKRLLSKPMLALMVALKNDLENNNVNLVAWHDRISDLLNTAGLEWGSDAAESMLAKLRSDMHLMFLENGKFQSIDAEAPMAGHLSPGMEVLLAEAMLADNVAIISEEKFSDPQAPQTIERAVEFGQNTAAQSQLLQDLNYHPYLKQDASKEVLVVKNEKYADAGANSGMKFHDEFSADFRAQQRETQSERQSGDQRQNTSRFEFQGEPDAGKNTDEPKTNSAERKTPFGQFFENVAAQRETSGASDAPKLNLSSGLSQGETLHDGLSSVVRFIRADGTQKASLIVDPPALGRISVELVSGTAGLEASIKVSSEQIRQLIQDHLVQLKLSLEQQGVQLTHFSVDVQQDNTRGNHSHGDRTPRSHGRAGDVDVAGEEALPCFQVDLNQGLLYWIA